MKILRESKEDLPISFLTSRVSAGWENIGNIKADIEAIHREFKGTKKVEEILQDLMDAEIIAVGRLQALMEDQSYLDYSDDMKKAINESLNEADEESDDEIEAELDAIDIIKDKVDIQGEGDTVVIAAKGEMDEEDAPKVEFGVTRDEFESLAKEFNDEDDGDNAFDMDFDEPVGDKLTDDDIYAKQQ